MATDNLVSANSNNILGLKDPSIIYYFPSLRYFV